MNRYFAVFAVLAAVAAFAAPAQAQQAAAYLNPFDAPSDFPATWYQFGDPFPWAVDGSPAGGHSGAACLNWNNGSDLDGYYPWGYWYTEEMDLSQYSSPVLSFWCRWDMDPDPYWHYREIYIYENTNYNYFYLPFNADYDGDGSPDLDCGATNQWHEHQIVLTPELAGASNVVFQFYTYLNDSDGAGYEGWFIDDFAILGPDVTPPDAISDLAAANPTLTEIELSWTSPNDDDVSGTTASFDLRVSTSPINGTTFANATQVTGEPAPGANGSAHNILVTGLTEDTTYFFAIQTTDIAGNVSPISNVPSLSTLAPPPPPPSTGGGETVDEIEVKDDILPCTAGASAAPMGLMALAGLIVLGFVLRRKA